MGKKVKIGKQRRDKYYHLAKEAGLRSRAVFKLAQLNRKFEFLQKSLVLVDLCAAPGGWLQVAAKHMPVSSLIIGVDLVPIKSMPHVITLQNDITTDSCRQAVKSNLQTWLADCVLHDGAPNVGKNWGHDAFTQAQLVLSALRLATEVLKRGGWFVTKIFRSPDHPALIEVFKKLFKKVFVTKPEASRAESSEIYAVCRGYLKPDKVDPALLDPKCVFANASLEPEKPKLNLFKVDKRRPRAEGYGENDRTLHHSFPAIEFITGDNHLEMLADAHELRLDGEENKVLSEHAATTQEIRECLRDIKVLGRKELRDLLNWRKTLRQHWRKLQDMKNAEDGVEATGKEDQEEEEPDEEVVLDNFVSELKAEEKRVDKRKRKKLMVEKRKTRQKIELKMTIPGDRPDIAEEVELFNLKTFHNQQKNAETIDPDEFIVSDDEKRPDDADFEVPSDLDFDDIGDLPDELIGKSKKSKKNKRKQPGLLMDLENGDEDDDTGRMKRKTDEWFKKDIFNNLVGEEDEDADIERVVDNRKRKTAKSDANVTKKVKFEDEKTPGEAGEISDIEKYSSEEDDDGEPGQIKIKNTSAHTSTAQDDDYDGFEVVSGVENDPAKKLNLLDATGMALAELWVHSSKTRRDLIESGYNRFVNNDENLPDWFVNDERKHYRPTLPVTKEAVEAYKLRMKEINARPIKKVAEAKARKKKRGVRRAERAKRRAEDVIESCDMTETQKAQEIRKIYKKSQALANKKPEVTYVVAKKSQSSGRRARRPAGVKGQFKVVDKRQKKDRLAEKRLSKNKKTPTRTKKR